MSLRPGAEHAIELWKNLPGSENQLKACLDLYDEVFSRVCERKKTKHLVAVEKKFNKMFENSDVKSIGTKDLRQMIELKHTKCKARPLRKDFDQGVRIPIYMNSGSTLGISNNECLNLFYAKESFRFIIFVGAS